MSVMPQCVMEKMDLGFITMMSNLQAKTPSMTSGMEKHLISFLYIRIYSYATYSLANAPPHKKLHRWTMHVVMTTKQLLSKQLPCIQGGADARYMSVSFQI